MLDEGSAFNIDVDEIRVYDEARKRIVTAQVDNYPRFATTGWDLVA